VESVIGKTPALGALRTRKREEAPAGPSQRESREPQSPPVCSTVDPGLKLSQPFLGVETHEKDFWAQQRKRARESIVTVTLQQKKNR